MGGRKEVTCCCTPVPAYLIAPFQSLARFGMAAPLLVQMEHDIDREMEQERLAEQAGQTGGEDEDWGAGLDLSPPEPPKMFYGPEAQIITNDLKSLDEMVSTR